MKYLRNLVNLFLAIVLTALAIGAIFIAPFLMSVITFVGIGAVCFIFIYALLTEASNAEDEDDN